jgi:hypothetical protein
MNSYETVDRLFWLIGLIGTGFAAVLWYQFKRIISGQDKLFDGQASLRAELAEHNTSTAARSAELKGEIDVFAQRFSDHDRRISNLEKDVYKKRA